MFRLIIMTGLLAVAWTQPCYAYLDAGTGSLLLQALLGGLAGLAYVGKLYWQRIKVFGRKLFGARGSDDPPAAD